MLLHRQYIFSTQLFFGFPSRPYVRLSPLQKNGNLPKENGNLPKENGNLPKKNGDLRSDVPRPPEWPWKAQGDEVLQTLANLNQESSLEAESPY